MLTQALPASIAPAPQAARGFAELDDRVTARTSGVVVARASSTRDVVAIAAHLGRRALAYTSVVVAHGTSPLSATVSSPVSSWTEVGARLGLGRLPCDPGECARRIAQSASARDVLVIVRVGEASWERSVASELVQLGQGSFVLLTTSLLDLPCDRFEVPSELSEEERQRWFSGLTTDARDRVAERELGALEAWWTSARTFVAEIAAPSSAAAEAARALLVLAGRGLRLAHLTRLGIDSVTIDELERASIIVRDGEWVSLHPASLSPEALASGSQQPNASDAERVAKILLMAFPDDVWSCARVAELELLAGNVDAADAAATRVTQLVDDAAVRRELVGRWAKVVDACAIPEARAQLQVSAAARALASGCAEEAYIWAKAAAASQPNDPRTALLFGRAAIAYGDLVTAQLVLERGRAESPMGELAASYSVELAEVAYRRGDLDVAFTRASAVLEGDALVGTRLQARNTLGKLLLAQSRWDEAEAHFAEDAYTAANAHDKTAELRADVNRGIAMLSRGHLEEARSTFETVLHEGERLGDPQACAFALDNLTVVAIVRHEYGQALELAERTFALRRTLGDRLTTAATVINITELRRKLGLFDHAEHSVAFGRRSLTAGMPKVHAARFGILRTRIALDRGNATDAEREVARLLPDADGLGHLEDVGIVHRLAARVAIEDGDVGRARAWIERAQANAATDEARAEVALLAAQVSRSEGTPDATLAREAVRLARIAHDEELTRQAHVLAAEILHGNGDELGAKQHVEQAVALCDRVVASLTGDVRAAFLARRDVQAVERLRAGLEAAASARSPIELESSARIDSIDDLPRTQRSQSSRPVPPRRELVGDDPTIRGLHLAIRKVARTDSTVLIRGESGTGKELVAEAVHRASERASGPFVAVNCAALVETLLLSELFGHEKGAFTGAAARRRGRFEMAEGGTLFLDEIGDISPRTQVALLRVLQEKVFERVGGAVGIHANVRVICATHRDLKAMVERGEFREDLYYRLRGITLEIPPLRARMGDLPRIAEHLLDRIAFERGEEPKRLSPEAFELLERHRWQGNVRELENALRAATLFADGEVVAVTDLSDNVEDLKALRPKTVPPSDAVLIDDGGSVPTLLGDEDGDLPAGEAGPTAVAYACVRQGAVSLADLKRQIERDCIARALAETRGNITRAAALLGMKRPRLSQLVKQYGLAAVSTED
jgi:transcriptional regulator with GAF, ATPase, and Fis domain